MEPSKPWQYHATINVGDPDGIHRRVTISANSLKDARAILEAEYGVGSIASLWGEVESQRIR